MFDIIRHIYTFSKYICLLRILLEFQLILQIWNIEFNRRAYVSNKTFAKKQFAPNIWTYTCKYAYIHFIYIFPFQFAKYVRFWNFIANHICVQQDNRSFVTKLKLCWHQRQDRKNAYRRRGAYMWNISLWCQKKK